MQMTESLLNASILETLVFWITRIMVLVTSLLFSKWLFFYKLNNHSFQPWVKALIFVPLFATLPMTCVEVILESNLPMIADHDDTYLRSISPIIAFIGEYFTILSYVFSINLIIWLVLNKRTDQESASAESYELYEPDQNPATPAFMLKAPQETYENIIAIKAEGHYIRLYNPKSSTLIHYVFKQAIKEMSEQEGSQIHRSWWIKHHAITKAQKSGKRYQLILSNDLSVPVSDSFVKQTKKLGLLDKRQ